MDWTATEYGIGGAKIEVLLLNEAMEDVLLGMVSSPLFREDIAIALDSRGDIAYNFACLGLMADGSKPRIYIIPELVEKLKAGDAEAKMILFHEVGHYVHKDYLVPQEEKDRVARAMDDHVEERELAADDFAAEYLGRDTVIEGLGMLFARMKKEYKDAPEAEIAIREVALRIAYQRDR